ncbi:hypothetical protein ACFY2H_05100 [Streptomyces griseofuscus]|uniref:hypothetical protein n=1 Tax=Streptomyces griseofuscus TaxID=146922 RepID=UPI0036757CF2
MSTITANGRPSRASTPLAATAATAINQARPAPVSGARVNCNAVQSTRPKTLATAARGRNR